MKKMLSILLVCCTLTFVVSACSGNANKPANEATNAPKTEVTEPAVEPAVVATDEDIVPEEGAKLIVWEGVDEKPFLEEMAKEFTAKYNIPVEYQEVGAGDQMAKVKADGPAGLGGDVMVMPHDHLGEAVAAGIVLPNDYYEEDTKANFSKIAVDALTMDGVLYGYPRNMETYLLYYNKNLVKEADLSSWDNIIKFSKTYNDVKNNKFGFMWEVNNWYYNYSFIAGNGGYTFGKGGTDPADIGINTPDAIEAMKFYQTLREALPIKAADASGDVKTELFQSGKLPINLDGIWQLGNFTQAKLGFEVGAVPMPPMPSGKSPMPFAGIKSYFVSSFSQYPNAAKLFIHFVTSQESLSKEYTMTGIIPARNGMDSDPAIQKDPRAQAFIEQFKNVEAMPAIIEMRQVWGPATAALEPIWNGGDVKQILDKAVADIKIGITQQSKE